MFRKVSDVGHFMHKKSKSRFSVGKFLFHLTEIVRRGTPVRFIMFPVPKIYMPKKGMSRFSARFVLFHISGTFCKATFRVSGKKWYRNFSCMRGGGMTIFRQNCFVSQYRIIS